MGASGAAVSPSGVVGDYVYDLDLAEWVGDASATVACFQFYDGDADPPEVGGSLPNGRVVSALDYLIELGARTVT